MSDAFDAKGNNELSGLMRDYLHNDQLAKDHGELKEKAKKRIQEIIGNSKSVFNLDGFEVSQSHTEPNKGTLVTQEMVGTLINARNGSTRLTVKRKEV